MEIKFYEDTHEYTINDFTVMSVTELIQWYGLKDVSRIPVDILQNAADRGSYTHEAIVYALDDNLAEVHPLCQPYMDAFEMFRADNVLETEHTERIIGSLDLGLAGTVDWIGKVNQVPIILDWKTSSKISKADILQLQMYRHILYQEYNEDYSELYVVQLKKNGKYKLYRTEDFPKGSYETAVAMINTYKRIKEFV